METNFTIDANTAVREILRRFPATRQVFDQYGLMGCGGQDGPAEPLSLFARVHQIDLSQLVAQIRKAAAESHTVPPPSVSALAPEADARPLPRLFIRSATLAFVTGGCLTGAIFLSLVSSYGTFEMASLWPGWVAHVQGHGHVQLSGWVALFVMGIAYFALPRFLVVNPAPVSAARTVFGLMLAGILLRIFYQPFSAERWAANWVFLGAAAELAAAVLFLRFVLKAVRSSARRTEPYTQFLVWGTGWLVVSQAILLVHAAAAVVTGEAVLLGKLVDEAYLHVMLMGFTGLYIMGVTLRTVPLMLDFRQRAGEGLQRRVLWAWNGGVFAFAAGQLASAGAESSGHLWIAAGAWIELLAGAAFLAALNPFQRPRASLDHTPVAWLWLVRSAYAWLGVALAMQVLLASWPVTAGAVPPQPYWGAFRHALTVGWISMMIFGMAYRMLPVMEGRAPVWTWTAPVVFVLANVGTVGRVALQSLGVTVPAVIPWMGATGFIEFGAGALFTLTVWKTMSPEQEVLGKPSEAFEITPETVVSKILDAYPESLEVFAGHGFTALRNPALRATAAKMVTVAQACRMHGIEPEPLLRDLRSLRESAQPEAQQASHGTKDGSLLVQLTAPTLSRK